MKKELNFKHYPKTDFFEVIDTIPKDHYFMITEDHATHAQNFSGILSSDCVRDLEQKSQKPSCGVPNCKLFYDEHKLNLIVAVNDNDLDLKDISGFDDFYQKALIIAKTEDYEDLLFVKKSLIMEKTPFYFNRKFPSEKD